MKLFCIIVTYNGIPWIERCLHSLLSNSTPVEIIVVDNASTDGTPEIISLNFPSVTLLHSAINIGFGQANNMGIRLALKEHGDYIFLLNQDVYIQQNTLNNLLLAHRLNPEFHLLSPVHLNGSGTALDTNFRRYVQLSDISDWIEGQFVSNVHQQPMISTEFVNAAAWLLTSESIRKTGGFDPFFFHYGEDINYCQRILFHQFKIGIVTGAFIYHDREKRRVKVANEHAHKCKWEWINLSNHLCDIRQANFLRLFLKRLLRYLYGAVAGLIKLDSSIVYFNRTMIWTMIISFCKIKKSRSLAKTSAFL